MQNSQKSSQNEAWTESGVFLMHWGDFTAALDLNTQHV